MIQLTNSKILQAGASVLRTDNFRNGAEWARARRTLPLDSAYPGKFNPDITPYFLEIYEAASNGKKKRVAGATGTQMAKTEFCFNHVGFTLDGLAVPATMAFPAEYLAKSISKDRFKKMLRTCDTLKSKVTSDQVFEKHIAGTVLRFVWTSSATQLCSHPTCLVIIDERDRMCNDVEGEGDPVELLDARTVTYGEMAKILITSTPTLWGASPIWMIVESGTFQKWCFRCMHCNKIYVPSLELFGWEEDYEDAWLICPECDKKNRESEHRKQILDSGQYQIFGNPKAETESFWVSGLASPWRKWTTCAQKWDEAKKSGDHNKMQTIVNTVFGETYKLQGDSVAWEELQNRFGLHEVGTTPPGVMIKTLGCDVQADCIYYALRGWESSENSYVIDFGMIFGNTEEGEVWQKLENLVSTLRPRICCIDSGYRSHLVYAFCRNHKGFCFPCKGTDQQGSPIRTSPLDTVYKNGKLQPSALRLYRFDDFYFKSLFYSALKMERINFPKNTLTEYLKQITSEHLVTSKNGKQVYEKRYAQNHWLDCEKLNLVAATIARVDLMGKEEKKARPRVISRGVQ